MDILDKKLEGLAEADFPAGLHGRIMRRVAFLRFRTPMLAVLAVLAFNVAISGWRLWTAIEENALLSILQGLFAGFEMSQAFFGDVLRALLDALPLGSFAILLVNVFLAVYVLAVYFSFRKLAPRS